jgi:glutaryl-CoA dehydrogenase
MVYQLSILQDRGTMSDEQASLAKVWISKGMRRIVSTGRELFGGNGILLEYDIAKYMADAEALYSYEGTAQINELIVGRSITGKQAFV